YLWLVPVAVFVGGTSLPLNYWNSRTKHFGRLSIARIVSSVVAQTTKLGAGFAGFVSGTICNTSSKVYTGEDGEDFQANYDHPDDTDLSEIE
ncbi:MAG: hypothetical protein ACNYWU_14275, partial [Desulfobacterales bacterium]